MGRREPAGGTSLLVRNLSRNARLEDLRYAAEKYGRVRDVYIPRDYYTGEPRGIGFIEYSDPRDAEDAKYALDRRLIDGREISVVFALQGRKRPEEYRQGSDSGRRGSPRGRTRSPRRRGASPPRRRRSYTRSRSAGSRSPPRRRAGSGSRSASPRGNDRSPLRGDGRSPPPPRRSPLSDRSFSKSPARE